MVVFSCSNRNVLPEIRIGTWYSITVGGTHYMCSGHFIATNSGIYYLGKMLAFKIGRIEKRNGNLLGKGDARMGISCAQKGSEE